MHVSVVMSYLSYCCLPISSKRVEILLWHQQVCSIRELLLAGYFPFFGTLSANCREDCDENSSSFLNTQNINKREVDIEQNPVEHHF